MIITTGSGTFERVFITDVQALDPITVIIEDFAPEAGRLTVVCWGKAWSAFWGSMGCDSVRAFVARYASAEYIASNLAIGLKQTKAERVYLERIALAVKTALQEVHHE